jgi:hypothetical protein
MKIFIICCLLFIHVNMCIYIMHMFMESPYCSYYVAIQSGFQVSMGLVLGTDYHLNRCSVRFRVLILGFGFRCPIAIPRDDSAEGKTQCP